MINMQIKNLSILNADELLGLLRQEQFDCCGLNDFWTESELKGLLDTSSDICLGCFVDEKIIAFCLTHYCSSLHKVYLENMFVREEYRKLGVATTLIIELANRYLNHNTDASIRFVALVDKTNSPARRVLEKAGYVIGNEMFWIQKNG